MKYHAFSLITLFVLCCFSFHAQAKAVSLGEDFNEFVFQGDKKVFVMFYASWCGRCTSVLPIWDELADLELSQLNQEVSVAKIDCSIYHSVCGRQLVGKYPTFVLYQDNTSIRFTNRDRILENFIQWLESEPQAEVKEIEEIVPLESQLIDLNEENISLIYSGIWVVSFGELACAHSANMIPILEELSAKSPELYRVGFVNTYEYKNIAEDFKIMATPETFIMYKGDKINFRGGRAVAVYDGFIRSLIAERDPIPEEGNGEELICRIRSDVMELTEENFNLIVPGKDVFILFYAPWCRFCTELQPLWDTLADEPSFNIAKVNAIEQEDIRFRYHIGGYPTLIFQRQDGSRTRFLGKRTKDKLIAFIDENKTPPSLYLPWNVLSLIYLTLFTCEGIIQKGIR